MLFWPSCLEGVIAAGVVDACPGMLVLTGIRNLLMLLGGDGVVGGSAGGPGP